MGKIILELIINKKDKEMVVCHGEGNIDEYGRIISKINYTFPTEQFPQLKQFPLSQPQNLTEIHKQLSELAKQYQAPHFTIKTKTEI